MKLEFTKLGNPNAKPDKVLETFPGTYGTEVTLCCTEFTCRCPVTNQPDWATIIIHYIVQRDVVESKSVKLFLETFRDTGVFHECLVWDLLDAFVYVLHPLSCSVTVKFNSRGGIAITAKASYESTLKIDAPGITSGRVEPPRAVVDHMAQKVGPRTSEIGRWT